MLLVQCKSTELAPNWRPYDAPIEGCNFSVTHTISPSNQVILSFTNHSDSNKLKLSDSVNITVINAELEDPKQPQLYTVTKSNVADTLVFPFSINRDNTLLQVTFTNRTGSQSTPVYIKSQTVPTPTDTIILVSYAPAVNPYDKESDKLNNDTLLKGQNGFQSNALNTYQELYHATVYINPNHKAFDTDSITRISFEKFWLKSSSKKLDQSRELIRVYYNRVEHANKHFSSYKRGWKTDRGMVYIVLGLPDIIVSETEQEFWIYSGNDDMEDLQFDFIRDTLTHENSFTLERSAMYTTVWKNAVSNWQNGTIFKPIIEE